MWVWVQVQVGVGAGVKYRNWRYFQDIIIKLIPNFVFLSIHSVSFWIILLDLAAKSLVVNVGVGF